MIEVIDRISTYPGRVQLTPVAGQENTYDMVRADDPIEVGTPINKALFDSYAAQIYAITQNVDNLLFKLSQRVQIGLLNDGALFGLYENGVLVPYIKLQSSYRTNVGYSAIERATVLRLDCVTTMSYRDSDEDPLYDGSNIDLWLQNGFINTLDAATQNVLQEVHVQSSKADNGSLDILRKVFLLSLEDYNYDGLGGFPTIGYNLLYFSDNSRRISNYKGTPIAYYTRSFGTGDMIAVIRPDGTAEAVTATTVAGVRPAFTLPLTFEVTAGMPSTANVMATAGVI